VFSVLLRAQSRFTMKLFRLSVSDKVPDRSSCVCPAFANMKDAMTALVPALPVLQLLPPGRDARLTGDHEQPLVEGTS
jgi:hypothetical protein